MNRKKTIVWLGAGMISILALASHASADTRRFGHPRYNRPAHQEIRGDRKELFKDRAELRGDVRELHKDKAELRRDLRNHAGHDEIARDRAEIRQDFGEIRGDRREIRQDHGELRRDLDKYGWNRNPNYNGRYSYAGNRFSGWDRNRWDRD
jgi:DNA repair exonuclease SbcCD ATPase subunit